ncbi:MAG: hypothetical protein ACREIS_05595 [Nitrospiraceae bacterium]
MEGMYEQLYKDARQKLYARAFQIGQVRGLLMRLNQHELGAVQQLLGEIAEAVSDEGLAAAEREIAEETTR